MNRRRPLIRSLGILVPLAFVACSTPEVPEHIRVYPERTAWPQTVEGTLQISVEEGDAGSDGICEENFGSITTGEKTVVIDVRGNTIRTAGISRAQAHQHVLVRAVLSGPSEYAAENNPMYYVSELTLLSP
jgi:hypothetical protein